MRAVMPVLLLVFLLRCAAPAPVLAAWPNSPFSNLPVCTASNIQQSPSLVSDGQDGAIMAWQDNRGGAGFDIYAQHVPASGVVDPAWPANGRAIAVMSGSKGPPSLVSDGAAGAIIAWYDPRSGNNDIYVHHVLAGGAVDPAWPVNGRALCTAIGSQQGQSMVSDGAGGAIVVWHDLRGGVTNDIYAQHVLATGAVDPAWPVDGRAVCTATSDQQNPVAVSDGSGGVLIAWQDLRGGVNNDIYAMHVLASGALDPVWPANGRAICTATNEQLGQRIAGDGAGGAIVSWHDLRGGANYDVYAQHVLAAGTVDGVFPADGRAVCSTTGNQIGAALLSDGAGGAFLAWQDLRGANYDVYAHHLLASGVVDPAWTANGVPVCVLASDQSLVQLASDGAGGVLVAWADFLGTNYDIEAQHVLSSGIVDPVWPTNGRVVSSAAADQQISAMIDEGSNGLIAVWGDTRAGASNRNIYAQRVGRHGYLGTPEPVIAAVADVPNDQGGVAKVSWNASYLEGDPYNLVTAYKIFRSVPPPAAEGLRAGSARVSADALTAFDRPGDLWMVTDATTTTYWEYLETVTADFLSGYSAVEPTGADSGAGGAPTTAYMVQARTAGTLHWESLPVSGYSVDDLAPAAPAPFTATYWGGTTFLHWGANREADLAGYRLYRGASAGFVPALANRVATPADTGYADAAGVPSFYKLSAVDVHGNESPVATLAPSGTVATPPPALPVALAFAAPWPNPARAAVRLRFALPGTGVVRLAVFDAGGRQVRELANEVRTAGEYADGWDLRDAAGRQVGAGLYFARLEAGGRVLVRRLAIAP